MSFLFNFFKKGKEVKEQKEKKDSDIKQETAYQRQYIRLNRDIGVLSNDIPGYKTVTRDISLGGAKIEISKPIPKGKIIDIKLELETGKTVSLKAEVTWIREVEYLKKYELGLKFIYNNPNQQQEIEKYILYVIETQSNWYKTIK
jgi:c-di-GMP-binding flagellar brake protein YcgR